MDSKNISCSNAVHAHTQQTSAEVNPRYADPIERQHQQSNDNRYISVPWACCMQRARAGEGGNSKPRGIKDLGLEFWEPLISGPMGAVHPRFLARLI